MITLALPAGSIMEYISKIIIILTIIIIAMIIISIVYTFALPAGSIMEYISKIFSFPRLPSGQSALKPLENAEEIRMVKHL